MAGVVAGFVKSSPPTRTLFVSKLFALSNQFGPVAAWVAVWVSVVVPVTAVVIVNGTPAALVPVKYAVAAIVGSTQVISLNSGALPA